MIFISYYVVVTKANYIVFQPSDGFSDDQWSPYTRPVTRLRLCRIYENSATRQQSGQAALNDDDDDDLPSSVDYTIYKHTLVRIFIYYLYILYTYMIYISILTNKNFASFYLQNHYNIKSHFLITRNV